MTGFYNSLGQALNALANNGADLAKKYGDILEEEYKSAKSDAKSDMEIIQEVGEKYEKIAEKYDNPTEPQA